MDIIKQTDSKLMTDFKKHMNNFNAFAMKKFALFLNTEREKKIQYIALSIIFILVISIILYIRYKFNLYYANCKLLKSVYNTRPTLSSIDENSPYLLRDYYIKTAYNCCASGQFRADFVGLCALRTCIEQGVRCLDFEIYSIDNKPEIAVSSINDFTVKESFNSISTADAFNTIINMAFSNTHCPNPGDPLILHFRILSKNTNIYDILANQISTILNSHILGVNYSFEFAGNNLGAVPIKNLLGKIIIMVDASNPLYQKTKLDEYINISSGSPFMRLLKFQDVKFTQDLMLKSFNKRNMSIVLPDWSVHDQNPNFNIARQYGCQMIGMSFQNFDGNLEHYNVFFDKNRTAFVLKPDELRYIPVTIKVPPKAPETLSYQSRPIKSDFYNFTI